MSNRIIVEAGWGGLPTPADINANDHLWNSFDHSETEISAGWLVRFAQARGRGWEPFTPEEIEAYYSRKFKDGFRFNRLVDPEYIPLSLALAIASYPDELVPAGGGWIVLDGGKYYFTEEFVRRCHTSSPAKVKAGD